MGNDSDNETIPGSEDIDWRDYIAIVVALAQTVVLPFILIGLVLLLFFIISLFLI